MRILFITNLYPPFLLGGYEILCAQVCRALAARGHDIHVLTTDAPLVDSTPVGNEGAIRRDLKIYLPFGRPPRLLRSVRRRVSRANEHATHRVISDCAPDCIFIWSQLRLTLGCGIAAEASGRPVLYTLNDTHIAGYRPAPFRFSPRGIARYVLDNLIYPDITLHALRMPHATCISETLRDMLREQGVDPPDCRVIYQGIPVERFPLKDQPGRISSPLSLLYSGQLHRYKGVHTLIDAARRVADAHPKMIGALTIAGAGDEEYTAELAEMAKGCPFDVVFPGRLAHNDMPALYRAHDIFVFPSIWAEPFGLTHLEAMASGTPVISTGHGGQGECLTNGENALIFPREDDAALAGCIERLATHDDLARTIARNARDLVETRLSLDRYVADLEAYLAELGEGS